MPEESQSVVSRKRFILLLLAALLFIFFKMIAGLVFGVLMAMILWTMTRGIYEWYLRKTKGKQRLAVIFSLLTNFLLIIVPAVGLFALLASDAVDFAASVQDWFAPNQEKFEQLLNKLTLLDKVNIMGYELAVEDITEKLKEFLGAAGNFLLGLLKQTAGSIAGAVGMILVMLYTLYFCYQDGDKFMNWLKRLLPLSPEQSDTLIQNFLTTSRASIKSVVIIGAVQGLLGGIAFWICGIPSPIMWGVITAIASVIPVVGAQIILFPAGLVLVATGHLGMGIGLLLWSWIVIANIDNFLRPVLVGKDTNLHELLVFLSTIGGITTFGFFGFLIGPVIASLLLATLQIYETMASEKS